MFVFLVLIECLSCFLHNVIVETVFILAGRIESVRITALSRLLHYPVLILFCLNHPYIETLLLKASMGWQVCDLMESPSVVVRTGLNTSE